MMGKGRLEGKPIFKKQKIVVHTPCEHCHHYVKQAIKMAIEILNDNTERHRYAKPLIPISVIEQLKETFGVE